MNMNAIDYVAWLLIVIGGLNWGMVGLFEYNLVNDLFGADTALSNTIYILVGLAAVYSVISVIVKLGKKVSPERELRA